MKRHRIVSAKGRHAALSRRELLQQAIALGGLAVLPARLLAVTDSPRLRSDPFTLGVASGFPQSDSVVLWTRLAPEPQAPGGGMPDAVVPVEWEIAADPDMRRRVDHGVVHATPGEGHSVHVEPAGLEPGRPYWYRFTAGDVRSPVGRTATAAAPGAPLERLRLALASCQQYEHGYYVAYRHMLADELDLIVHVGDYIYESSWGDHLVRSHGAPEIYSLHDYRARHALYRSDADLQAAHAACPWLLTWDDHEVDNDYAGDVSEENDDPALFLARRAAAYRAYYEHMPLPRRALPAGPHLRLYAQRAFGDLAQICTLDTRQYRDPHACPPPGERGGNRVRECPELSDAARGKLGSQQESWLAAQLAGSRARWNLIAQGTVMTHIDEQPGAGEQYWTDAWSGYPAARDRLLGMLAERRIGNPVVLSGDIHAFLACDLNRVPADRESPVIASELVTTSISSQGSDKGMADRIVSENPNVRMIDNSYRGYLRIELSRERLLADMIAMETVKQPESERRVLQSFVVEDGRPGPRKA